VSSGREKSSNEFFARRREYQLQFVWNIISLELAAGHQQILNSCLEMIWPDENDRSSDPENETTWAGCRRSHDPASELKKYISLSSFII
jgi:hypothetical protein